MMEKIELTFRVCPFCGKEGTLTMNQVKTTKIKAKKVVKGIFDVWACGECKQEFFHHWKFKSEPIKP